MNNTGPYELLTRYFSGEATTEERAKIEAWRQASPENQRVFAELSKIWQEAIPESLTQIPDIDQSWSELAAKLGLPKEQQQARILEMKKRPQPNARSIIWSSRSAWAAAAVILLALGMILYQALQNSGGLRKITTAYAERVNVQLPDGSRVILNSGSEIQFPKQYPDSVRYVNVLGEAYFEVTPDRRPFLVKTENAQIRVLGTKFGVWARNAETRVTVREGRLVLNAIAASEKTAVELTANHMSVCRRQNPPDPPRAVDAAYALGWLEGKIVFDQTPLTEVVAELQRIYKVAIELSDPTLGQQTITGSFHNKPIESVLASVCLALNLRYAKQAGKYIISE
jgi:ferric-dicitrate binding protein FerR (iron transport regulator)